MAHMSYSLNSFMRLYRGGIQGKNYTGCLGGC